MKQNEISRYLKFITIGISLLFVIFVVWFLPMLIRETIVAEGRVFWGICSFFWITAIPCFLSLWKFWGICVRIGQDKSFSRENAEALKQMSHYMLTDAGLYAVVFIFTCIFRWYQTVSWLLFGILLILFVCITLTILCAALSHLVYKASQMQEEQDLTI